MISRTRRAGFSILGLMALGGIGLALPPAPPGPETRFAPCGTGSCAASACHGSARTLAGSRVERTESLTWLLRDPHARAYQTLRAEESARIVQALGWGMPADREPRCLSCHATPTGPRAGPAAPALVAEGVGCESCHGPASGWLADHAAAEWHRLPADRKRTRGMTPLDDLTDRAKACVGCHVGAPPDPGRGIPAARDVNHDLIAAGHPRLAFEFASALDRMPKHWDESAGVDAQPDFPASAWRVGQVVSAHAALDLLRHRAHEAAAGRAPWPELAEYECGSCHRPISATVAGTGTGRTTPAWGSWYFPMLDPLASALDDLRRLMERPAPAPEDVLTQLDASAPRLGDRAVGALDARALEALAGALAEEGAEGTDRAAQRYLGLAPVVKALERMTPGKVDPELGRELRRLLDRAVIAPPERGR